MTSIKDLIRNIRTKYENWAVREDMAAAIEYLVSAVTGLKHNSGAANLIEYPAEAVTRNGITYELTDEGIHVYGTVIGTDNSWLPLDWGKKNLIIGKPYVASLNKTGNGAIYLSLGYFLDDAMSANTTIGSTESVYNFTCPPQYVSSRNMLWIPTGSTVDAVVKPNLRLANEEDPTQPETYTVEEISQKIHSGSMGGGKGFKAVKYANLMTDPDMIYVYTGSEPQYQNGFWYYHNGTNFVVGAQFYLGRDGVDGTSPTANVTAITGGARITVTDTSGTTSVDIHDAENEDTTARQSIEEEISRAQAAEEGLDTRVSALESSGSSFTWSEILRNETYGAKFVIKACTGLGLFLFDMSGVWSSIPDTSGKFVSLGQADELKYAAGYYSDHWKTHFQFSKNYKAELYIAEDGTVYFGQTAELSTNNNIKVTKGAGCRHKNLYALPSVTAGGVS
jgi:hypothetical protein